MIKLKFKYMYMLYYCLYKADFGYRKINRHMWTHSYRKERFFYLFIFLCLPYNKHLINRAKSVCMGES